MYLAPRKLMSGDTIGVVSPASPPIDEQRFYNGIAYLEKLGFRVVPGENVLNQYGYLAGTDQARANDVNRMFADPQIDAIFCTRGGYGCGRILNMLDYERMNRNPKIFVGYSDITMLQHALLVKANLISFSGPMVAVEMGDGLDALTANHFWEILKGTTNTLSSKMEASLAVVKNGIAEGPIIAGCLSVLVATIGTSYMADYKDAILVVEDIGEEPYQIDRKLSHLKATGIFDQVQAVVFGQFLQSEPQNKAKPTLTVSQIIDDLLGDFSIPIVVNYPYGHGNIKYTIPIGAQGRLDTYQKSFEVIDEIVV